MKKVFLVCVFAVLLLNNALGSGEPSTYFNIYVPPNNEAVQRNVALIVTAISDSTSFTITDDDMDGDNDDNVSGILMAGQSYILYIKDNGINDDAQYASGGVLKRDGDYYTISSNNLVYASMSTDSDWQHDFVPSVNKKSVGEKFIVYAPKISSSPRDLNVFAYEDNTTITISRISQSPTTQTGYTNVNIHQKNIVVQRSINRGQDIIHYFQDGRNVMNTGETYMIEANKAVSVQYGALWANARDGGAYVPSSNGSSSGELFYFAVPYQASGEQEIRIVSWDDNNDVTLERYNSGSWINMDSWNLNSLSPADWVGKQNGNATYPTVFRVACTPGKRVSVFEANWMETGFTNTSDMATMVTSIDGTTSGKEFLVYMLPPGAENKVINPFTGSFFNGSYTHFYLFAESKNTTVTVKDAKTNGQVLNRTYEIEAGRYADAFFDIAEWQSIYNGTGTPSGPDRPYMLIESTENIAILSTNFNDNWMTYFGSSLPQSFMQEGSHSNSSAIPGDTITLTSRIILGANDTIENPTVEINVGSGAIPVESNLTNNTNNETIQGEITYKENNSAISFNSIPNITGQDDYEVETIFIMSSSYNDGTPVAPGTVVSVETIVTGEVDGQLQQSMISQGIENNADNTSNLLFSPCGAGNMVNAYTDSWNGAWVDYDNDGWEDLFVTDKNEQASNQLFRNEGNDSFTQTSSGVLFNNPAKTVSSVWADINNDGFLDAFTVNATGKRSSLYLNNGNGSFTELTNAGIDIHPEYFHGAAFADFDNDGFVDLIITNFFPTRFHQLYRNNGNNTFSLTTNTPVTTVSERAMAPLLADYDNDGLVDIFIPNGNDRPNSLFRNLGAFQFEKITEGTIVTDAKNSVGAAWGDYDNDGDLDLFVANASGQHNDLYQNNGNGTFTKVTQSIVVQQGGHSHGVAWMDVDNDSDLDLFVSNDQGPNYLYMNDGTGTFTRKLDESIAGDIGKAYGTAWADHNKDGFLDAMIFTHDNDQNKLFCNNGNTNHWINIKLVGNYSNKAALGAKVKIKAGGIWQTREILPISGFGSQHSIRAHFGINDAQSIDSLIVFWPSGHEQVITSGLTIDAFTTIVEESSKQLHGITFNDGNENGQRDTGEEIIGNVQLEVTPLNRNIASNAEGAFRLHVQEGDYTLAPINLVHWSASPVNAFLDQSTDSVFVEVPLQAITAGHDLSIDVATTAWRRGFTGYTSIQVSNTGTITAYNTQIEMDYPNEAYVLESSWPSFNQNANTYSWSIDSVSPGEVISINVLDSISLDAFTGQKLMLSGTVSADGEDLDTTNNSYAEEIEVVGAIDPNDILVSPKGEGSAGFIPKDQWLTYTIRFQNIGTFRATYVFVENILSASLDYSTFEIIASSHDYTYQLKEDGLLKIAYRYIHLPDSVTNEQESHGYFKYRIKPKQSLSGGETITNQAAIVFDYEAPVITNTVLNTIKYAGKREVKQLRIHPNPATLATEISIDTQYFMYEASPSIQSYVLRDNYGRVLRSVKINAFYTTISVADLPNGIYLIEAYDNQNNVHIGKLLVE